MNHTELQEEIVKIKKRIYELENTDELSNSSYDEEYHELERKLEDLRYSIKSSQTDSIPTPKCCQAAQNYPAIFFETVHLESSRYDANDFARWYVEVSDIFYQNFRGKKFIDYNMKKPAPKFCCYCSTPLPKMIKDETIKVCEDSDGNYCGTCNERLSGCCCLPPAAAYKIME